jgi:hypothetical protein
VNAARMSARATNSFHKSGDRIIGTTARSPT